MRPFYLIIFPLIFLVTTGFIYTNWLSWMAAGGIVTTVGSLSVGNLTTTDPLLNLISGNYAGLITCLFTTNFLDLTGIIVGAILILLGLGIGITVLGLGWSMGDQGSKLLQTVGIGILVWSFTDLFAGTWLSVELGAIGTIVRTVLGLIFVLGVYWQSQTTM